MHKQSFSEWTEFFSGLIVTDRYRSVLLHLLFASSSLTGKAGVWIEKRQLLDFRRSSFAQNWSRITKNLSHRFLLSRKTAAAWAAMPFTTLTNLTSLSLWAAQRAELSPTQKPKSSQTQPQLLSHSATDHMVSLRAHLGQNFTIAKSLWDSSWAQLSQLSAWAHWAQYHHQHYYGNQLTGQP